MLEHLHIKNVALIKESEISFGEGLNILTGETGAGKSMVIDSLQFEQCNKALKRIVPKVHLDDLFRLIDSVECISDLQKEFYKTMIRMRFELILNHSYKKLQEKDNETSIRTI